MPDKPTPPANPIDPATAALIRRKAHALTRSRSDYDDVAQELTLELLHRLADFDPDRGKREAFVRLLLDHAAADIVRRRDRDRLRTGDPPDPAVEDPNPRQADLARDLAAVLARLPAELQQLAGLLMGGSVTAAARAVGVPRTTLYGRVQALRAHLEAAGLGDYLDNPSVTSPGGGVLT